MKTLDFNYDLPRELIAQTPAQPRDPSRLLVLKRTDGSVRHMVFQDLPAFLVPGDLLVINQTRVLPARLYAKKKPTGGKAEILLLQQVNSREWEVLVGGKGIRPGGVLSLEDSLEVLVLEDLGGARRLVKFSHRPEEYLIKHGQVPLPPYIDRPIADPELYQTVFSKDPGSAAAPTAGLHFTPRLIDELLLYGVQIATITLHIGLDTFSPVSVDDPNEHHIHTEWCRVSRETADRINRTKERGGRVIAVGTTSVRSLETAAITAKGGEVVDPFTGRTDLFILPGYDFKVVDAIITNFHLPRSSLLMLISAFAGRKQIMSIYDLAIQEGYRFYSFGDAMLIL